MTKQQQRAKREWMSRSQFFHTMPWSIEHDVCSEGLTPAEIREILSSIAADLQALKDAYARASVERT